ncbi:MAG: ATP-binding protein [Gammaproteobacteria bacterium]|nr:ATP-binding protein [Gammaproteobacteria bacterium]
MPRISVLPVSAKHYADDYSVSLYDQWEYEPDEIETQLFYLVPVLGVLIIILFIMAMRLVRIARANVRTLDQTNQTLKREISDRMQAEDTKQKLEKALLQGQKLQAIGTLAGGIAHDFNNILYAIIGYVEMAQDDVEKNSLVYKNLGKVLEASHRGRELIARILAFSRRQQHHELKPLSLKTTIENVLSLLKPTIPSSVTIEYQVDTHNECAIMGDQTQIHQIIVNLVNNAVDAMDGDGLIQIHLSQVTASDPAFHLFPQLRPRNYCKIEVIDTGYGMEQSTIERIFEPFFTTKEVGKGTGLGLATVHGIVKEHDGEIFVTSQLGTGSTFIIFLPEYSPLQS